MWKTACATFFFLLVSLALGGKARYCFRCINLECDPAKVECHNLYTETVKKLRTFYEVEINEITNICPKVNELGRWRRIQIEDGGNPCTTINAKCAVGRIKISLTPHAEEDQEFYGVVMGCAKDNLIKRAMSASIARKCYVNNVVKNATHHIKVEQCADEEHLCNSRDYCANFTKGEIRKLEGEQETVLTPINIMSWTLIAVASIFTAFCVLACCSWYQNKLLAKIQSRRAKKTEVKVAEPAKALPAANLPSKEHMFVACGDSVEIPIAECQNTGTSTVADSVNERMNMSETAQSSTTQGSSGIIFKTTEYPPTRTVYYDGSCATILLNQDPPGT